jgi:hypothetical protein
MNVPKTISSQLTPNLRVKSERCLLRLRARYGFPLSPLLPK